MRKIIVGLTQETAKPENTKDLAGLKKMKKPKNLAEAIEQIEEIKKYLGT